MKEKVKKKKNENDHSVAMFYVLGVVIKRRRKSNS